MTQDKLEVNDNLPIDRQRQTAPWLLRKRGTNERWWNYDLTVSGFYGFEAEDISLQFLPYTLLASFMISLLIANIYARTIVAPILEIKRVTRRMMDWMLK